MPLTFIFLHREMKRRTHSSSSVYAVLLLSKAPSRTRGRRKRKRLMPPATARGEQSAALLPVRLAGGWCWFVLREEYCWLVAAGCWWLIRSERKVLLAGG
jgi:hypothetical protein